MERQTCVDCQRQSPPTKTNYTLISSQHGWRLARTRKGDGRVAVEWRCPPCWRRFKEDKASDPSASPPKHDSARSIFARASRRLLGRSSEPPER